MNNIRVLSRDRIRQLPDHFEPFKDPWEGFPHILRTQQFSRRMIESLIFKDTMKTLFHLKNRSLISYLRDNKITVVTYFYEPSTRTRMSFERAILFLGANIIHTESGGIFSSAAKGESLADTARVVSGVGLDTGYADLLIIRHPEEQAVEKAAEFSRVPVINAGDGQHQHPTQAFLDLATIFLRFGRIDNISIAMIGDIHSGRTIRSLCYLLSKFEGVKIYLVSPEEIRIRDDIKEHLRERNVWFREETNLNSVLPKVDVCYFTRLQAERYKNEIELFEQIRKQIPQFSLTKKNINLIPDASIVLHPLPIGDDEIRENCKSDKRIWAFIQSDLGVATRMALINRIFRELAKREMHSNFKQTIFSSLGWK